MPSHKGVEGVKALTSVVPSSWANNFVDVVAGGFLVE